MKRIVSTVLVLATGFALGVAFFGINLNVRAGPAAPVPSGNGDTNGDGSIDIADAVYTLIYLFKGGPAPVACADSPELVARIAELEVQVASLQAALDICEARPPAWPLLATGQTTCYDNSGGVVPCDSTEYPGQDGFYRLGCPQEGKFTLNGDGTISDACTGLTWQHDAPPPFEDWKDALQYCHALDLGGHHDWRLPNILELLTLNTLIDAPSQLHEIVPADEWNVWQWSSTSDGASASVYFYNLPSTEAQRTLKTNNGRPCLARAVRGP